MQWDGWKNEFHLYLLENFSFSDVRLVHKTQWWVLKVFDSLSCVLFDTVKTVIIFFQKNFFPSFSFLFYIFVYLYWLHIDITIYLCYIILYTGPVFIKFQKYQTIRISKSTFIGSRYTRVYGRNEQFVDTI